MNFDRTASKGGTPRAAIYCRVSTKDQNAENQHILLREVAERNGWTLVDTYTDQGLSGALGRDRRPELDRMMGDLVRRRFDVLLVWDVSRLGRSLRHLVGFLDEIVAVGCDLYVHQQGLDTTTPSGRMLFQMVGVFAEFERSLISERVKLGLSRAKSQGVKLGRPRKGTRAAFDEVQRYREAGMSLDEIASKARLSRSTTYRLLRQVAHSTERS